MHKEVVLSLITTRMRLILTGTAWFKMVVQVLPCVESASARALIPTTLHSRTVIAMLQKGNSLRMALISRRPSQLVVVLTLVKRQ